MTHFTDARPSKYPDALTQELREWAGEFAHDSYPADLCRRAAATIERLTLERESLQQAYDPLFDAEVARQRALRESASHA